VSSTCRSILHSRRTVRLKSSPDNLSILTAVHDRRYRSQLLVTRGHRIRCLQPAPNIRTICSWPGEMRQASHTRHRNGFGGDERLRHDEARRGQSRGRSARRTNANRETFIDISPRRFSELLRCPGKARRTSLERDIVIPDDAMESAGRTADCLVRKTRPILPGSS